MVREPCHAKVARHDAAVAFLDAFREGRPLQELRTALPRELEATGQADAARFIRTFFAPRTGSWRPRIVAAG
jgi:hypothetical protein